MKIIVILFVFISAGLLFSGYLSAVKLFSGACAFNESCPYFLGYPACWYGFSMYLFMFIVTGIGLTRKLPLVALCKADAAVSLLGIIFAGSFVVQEIAAAHVTGTLGLSTCAYGLIFYIAIFVTALVGLRKSRAAVASTASPTVERPATEHHV
ncbi:MAG: hypothetical protein ABSE18_01480 [Minisyncoccia bacterium]|jgi:hypothetical protein